MKRKRPSSAATAKKRPATTLVVARQQQANYQVGRTHPRQPKAELKCFDIALTTSTLTGTGGGPAAVVLNAIPQGADFFQRIGRKVYMKSLHFTGVIFNNATTVEDYGRIVILYDSQPNAALPTFATTFRDANAAAASTIFSGLNIDERERFRILMEERIQIPPFTNTAGVLTNPGWQDGSQHLKFDRFIKLKGLETVYNSTNGGTIADITSGSLIIFFFSTQGNVQVSWQNRLRYYD